MKNILLLFASDFKVKSAKENKENEDVKSKDENHFDVIPESKYQYMDSSGESHSFDTIHTNESATHALYCEIGPIDKVFVFTTDLLKDSVLKFSKPVTQYEYFMDVIMKYVVDQNTENIINSPYHEKNPLYDSMLAIVDMANKILSFKKSCGVEDVTLHADMTGGMRNATMLMLGVMRFLQYSNIKMGRIFYSNWNKDNKKDKKPNMIEDARDIYDFFDLVAGAEDFVNHGSAKALLQYYEHLPKSKCLNSLLEAMRNFSEQIQLCHRGEFQKVINKLRTAIHDFDTLTEDSMDANDKLFAPMLVTLKEQYGVLLENDSNDLDTIDWCTRNGYLQQALTLYTECIPEYVMSRGLFYPTTVTEPSVRKQYDSYQNQEKGSYNYYLLGNCKLGNIPNIPKARAPFEKLVKRQFDQCMPKNIKYFRDQKLETEIQKIKEDFAGYIEISDTNNILQCFKEIYEIAHNQEYPTLTALEKGQPVLYQLLQNYFQATCTTFDASYAFFNNFISYYMNFSSGEKKRNQPERNDSLPLKKRIKEPAEKTGKGPKEKNNPLIDVFEVKFARSREYDTERAYDIKSMLAQKKITSKINDQKLIIKIVDDYFFLRDERNNVNHAKKDKAVIPLQELQERIHKGTAIIRKAFNIS